MGRAAQEADVESAQVSERLHTRRNRAEQAVRARLDGLDKVYVDRSSWRRNGHGPEVFVAVVARDDDARDDARSALADIAGLTDEQWVSAWIGLNLGDWMIRVFPRDAQAPDVDTASGAGSHLR